MRLEHRIPPPVVALLIGAAMWIGARNAALLAVKANTRIVMAGFLFAFGLVLDVLALVAFQRAHTTINPLQPEAASSIVTGGIYRYTRNPMYVGLTVELLGWAAYLAAPWGFLGPIVFVAFITRFQIIPEERELTYKFGNDYVEYQRRVGRWL